MPRSSTWPTRASIAGIKIWRCAGQRCTAKDGCFTPRSATWTPIGSHAAVNRGDYKILNVVTGDPKAGMAFFAAHCAACHSSKGDLAHIAAKYDPPVLQGRFLYPK